MARDESYIKSAVAYIKQRELSILHSKANIKHYQFLTEIHLKLIDAEKQQQAAEEELLERVRKEYSDYLAANPE